jgi:hypothetical protein
MDQMPASKPLAKVVLCRPQDIVQEKAANGK